MKFVPIDPGLLFTGSLLPAYEVWEDEQLLGYVIQERRSTDTRVGNSRLRRPGRGAPCWRAQIPKSAVESPGVHSLIGDHALSYRGTRWQTRRQASEALLTFTKGRT